MHKCYFESNKIFFKNIVKDKFYYITDVLLDNEYILNILHTTFFLQCFMRDILLKIAINLSSMFYREILFYYILNLLGNQTYFSISAFEDIFQTDKVFTNFLICKILIYLLHTKFKKVVWKFKYLLFTK